MEFTTPESRASRNIPKSKRVVFGDFIGHASLRSVLYCPILSQKKVE